MLLIFIWTIIIILMFLFSIGNNVNLKSEIISVGILGTFIGILISLNSFDVLHIKESLPQILAGMKIAFITSVEGMGVSILLSLMRKRNPDNNFSTKIIENFFIKSLKNQENMIINQEKLLKTIENDTSNKTNEFIQALDTLVQKFNSNMVEEFGENFAQLDKTVEKFLEEQKFYQQHLKELHNELESVTHKQEEINKVYQGLFHSSENIKNTMNQAVEIIHESLSLALKEANGRF